MANRSEPASSKPVNFQGQDARKSIRARGKHKAPFTEAGYTDATGIMASRSRPLCTGAGSIYGNSVKETLRRHPEMKTGLGLFRCFDNAITGAVLLHCFLC